MSVDLMTAEEVAAKLKVKPSVLKYWRSRGEGPVGFKVGKYVRYDAAEVDRFIDASKADAA